MRKSAGLFALLAAFPLACAAAGSCGEVVTLQTHAGTTARHALSGVKPGAVTLVMLAGGGGHLDLDEAGCPRALKGNSLVRGAPLFRDLGFATVLVDAPSDHSGEDGLAGFRAAPGHAEDLGKVIADVRSRTRSPVWLLGTSRGTISAANAAARLSGAAAPDGVVLTSVLSTGNPRGQKAWVAQSVFDVPLASIRMPLLLVGHAQDTCSRTPAGRMQEVAALANGAREQVVMVTGGPGSAGVSGLQACEGRSPHGFAGQEAEVSAGIARFIRGGRY